MKLIVGLGNPGEKYRQTRHNIGFIVLDHLLEDVESLSKTFWEEDKTINGLFKRVKLEGEDVILLKPLTFMNASGYAVKKALSWFHIAPTDAYIVHDDVDLPIGTLRVRFGGAAGGHRGVASIIETLGTDQFLRIRLGIGRPIKIDRPSASLRARKLKVKSQKLIEDYVLSNFESGEKGAIKHVIKRATADIKKLLKHGIDIYMSKYHNQSIKEKKSDVIDS